MARETLRDMHLDIACCRCRLSQFLLFSGKARACPGKELAAPVAGQLHGEVSLGHGGRYTALLRTELASQGEALERRASKQRRKLPVSLSHVLLRHGELRGNVFEHLVQHLHTDSLQG
jgi:hypothetical protein